MNSGNLEGSWYYMLLANEHIVKRTKATVLPMPNEVILHFNILALNRKTANVKSPVFESRNIIFDDDDNVEDDIDYTSDVENETIDENANADYTDEIITNNDNNVNEPYLESQLDMSDENHPPTLDEYVDDTLYVNDTTQDNDELYDDDRHDTTPKYDQAILDDIFGLSDDENDFDDVPVQPDVLTSPDTMIDTVHDSPESASLCCVEVVETTN